MTPTFTDQVKAVMQYSREEAARLGHDYIGTEHLLLGIIKDGQGVAVNVVKRIGVNLGTLKQATEDYVSTSGGHTQLKDVPFTTRTKQISEMAVEEARGMQKSSVGVEHILLALLKDHEGVAAQILAAFGVSYKMVLAELAAPGSSEKPKKNKDEQKAFVLYFRPVMDTKKRVVEKTNLGELNELLSGGWTVSATEVLSGGGAEGYFVSLLFLTRKAEVNG